MSTDDESALDSPTLELPPVTVRRDRAVVASVVATILLLGVMGTFLWFRAGEPTAVGIPAGRPSAVSAVVPAPPTTSASPVVVASVRPSPRSATKRTSTTATSPTSSTATTATSTSTTGASERNGQNGNSNNNGNGDNVFGTNDGNGGLFPGN